MASRQARRPYRGFLWDWETNPFQGRHYDPDTTALKTPMYRHSNTFSLHEHYDYEDNARISKADTPLNQLMYILYNL